MGACIQSASTCGCCPCCHDRRKYKLHVLNIYSEDDTCRIPKNTRDLLHYAQVHPNKLPNIGRYIEKLLRQDLIGLRYGRVHVAMRALNQLMDVCNTEIALSFYDAHISNCIELLMRDSTVDLILVACDTFSSLAQYQDAAHSSGKLDMFFTPLTAICQFEAEHSEDYQRVRQAGLSSMARMILFNDNTPAYFSKIIPAILDNFQSEEQKEETELNILAKKCLENLSDLLTMTNITSLLDAVFHFLDSNKWRDHFVALNSLKLIADYSTKQMKNAYLLLFNLFRHVEVIEGKENADLLPQLRIFRVASELISSMKSGIGPWQGVMQFLLQRLENSPYNEYSEGILTCIASYSTRLTNSLDLFAVVGMCVEESNQHGLNLSCREYLLKAARLFSTRPFSFIAADIPERTFISFIKRFVDEENTDLRIMLWSLILDIILPLEFLPSNDAESKPIRFLSVFDSSFESQIKSIQRSGPKMLTELNYTWLNTAIYRELSSPHVNHGIVELIFQLLVILFSFRPRYEVSHSIPMLVRLISEGKAPFSELNMIIIACLYFYGKIVTALYPDLSAQGILLEHSMLEIIDLMIKNEEKAPYLIMSRKFGLCKSENSSSNPLSRILEPSEILESVSQLFKVSNGSQPLLLSLSKQFEPVSFEELFACNPDEIDPQSVFESYAEVIETTESPASKSPIPQENSTKPFFSRRFSEMLDATQFFELSPQPEPPIIELSQISPDLSDISENDEYELNLTEANDITINIKKAEDEPVPPTPNNYLSLLQIHDTLVDFSSNTLSPIDKLNVLASSVEDSHFDLDYDEEVDDRQRSFSSPFTVPNKFSAI